MPRFGLQSLPRVDPLEILRRTGTGVADQTGVSQLVQGMMPGGGLNTFARQLAGGNPGAAWDTYADWRGPLMAGGEMQLPWGPGIAHVPGTRTPPARPLAQTLANRDLSRFVSRTQGQIARAPELSPGQAWAQSSMNELAMRDMGLGKAQLQARAEQARLREQVRAQQHADQWHAMAKQLNSLLPNESVVPFLSAQAKTQLGDRLQLARQQGLAGMGAQPPGIGPPIRNSWDSVPDTLERARPEIAGRLHRSAVEAHNRGLRGAILGNKAESHALGAEATRISRERPGFELERPPMPPNHPRFRPYPGRS